jgi:hypothetical protein
VEAQGGAGAGTRVKSEVFETSRCFAHDFGVERTKEACQSRSQQTKMEKRRNKAYEALLLGLHFARSFCLNRGYREAAQWVFGIDSLRGLRWFNNSD